MVSWAEKRKAVDAFIRANIRSHPRNITRLTQERFQLSRPAVMMYINDLISKRAIEVIGATKDREYKPLSVLQKDSSYFISNQLAEDRIWKEFSELAIDFTDNVRNICQFGFTEIVNNAIEHSDGKKLDISMDVFFDLVQIRISDDGVGIFNKIQKEFQLDNPKESILELSKGKLTTNSELHSGQGIFFTSRMFDTFSILSDGIGFIHTQSGSDVIDRVESVNKGTKVIMEIALTSTRTTIEVFDEYADVDDGFELTTVPVHLAISGKELLVSRSQARRILARFDKFKRVTLDFEKVTQIGQGFADEIFRVYKREHPETEIVWVNASNEIENMIKNVKTNN